MAGRTRGAKKKISRDYILKGIAKLLEVKQTNDFLQKNNISEEQVKQVLNRFRGNTEFS